MMQRSENHFHGFISITEQPDLHSKVHIIGRGTGTGGAAWGRREKLISSWNVIRVRYRSLDVEDPPVARMKFTNGAL